MSFFDKQQINKTNSLNKFPHLKIKKNIVIFNKFKYNFIDLS